MKCVHCHTHVIKIPVSWKCPYCGEPLPEPGFWFKFMEGFTEYLQDKGAVFWGVLFAFIIIFVGIFDMLLGEGHLFNYIAHNPLLSIAMIVFGGMLITMYVKVVLPLRIPYGTEFLLKERLAIRNIRKFTHIAVIAGVLISLLLIEHRMFISWTDIKLRSHHIPSFLAYLVVIGWFLGLAWSVAGLFINPKWLDDFRFRYYVDERLGVTSLKKYRKLGTVYIGVLVLTLILYYVMLQIPNKREGIQNMAIIGSIILLVKTYFSWLI